MVITYRITAKYAKIWSIATIRFFHICTTSPVGIRKGKWANHLLYNSAPSSPLAEGQNNYSMVWLFLSNPLPSRPNFAIILYIFAKFWGKGLDKDDNLCHPKASKRCYDYVASGLVVRKFTVSKLAFLCLQEAVRQGTPFCIKCKKERCEKSWAYSEISWNPCRGN